MDRKYSVVIRKKVDQDLRDICFYYVSQGASKIAERFMERVRQTYDELAKMPHLGSAYQCDDPLLPQLRVWRVKDFKKHLVFYLVIEAARQIRIVRILQGSRNIDAIFEDDSLQDD